MSSNDPQTHSSNDKTECVYFPQCQGCSLLNQKTSLQRSEKANTLAATLLIPHSELTYHSFPSSQLRDRVDLTVANGKIGFYDQNKEIIDIEVCQQLSPNLNQGLRLLRKFKFPITKGSLRLRVGPQKNYGLWLDFSNVDIKKLIDEKQFLTELHKHFFIEIGQKRKALTRIPRQSDLQTFNQTKTSHDDSLDLFQFKLKDPVLNPWFETYFPKPELQNTIELACHIASFTQPSMETNKKMAQTIYEIVKKINPKTIYEFGAGIGNFSLSLSQICQHLFAFEYDSLSIEAFQKNCEQHHLENKITILQGDFQKYKPSSSLSLKNKNSNPQLQNNRPLPVADLIFVNPPRSGIGIFIETILEQKPLYVLYLSCYLESMQKDTALLKENGYHLSDTHLFDQFPNTPHFESLTLWKRHKS